MDFSYLSDGYFLLNTFIFLPLFSFCLVGVIFFAGSVDTVSWLPFKEFTDFTFDPHLTPFTLFSCRLVVRIQGHLNAVISVSLAWFKNSPVYVVQYLANIVESYAIFVYILTLNLLNSSTNSIVPSTLTAYSSCLSFLAVRSASRTINIAVCSLSSLIIN